MLTGTAMHRQRVTDSRISTAFFTEVRYCRHSVMLCPFDLIVLPIEFNEIRR